MKSLACSLQKCPGHGPPRKAEELIQIKGEKSDMTTEILKRCGWTFDAYDLSISQLEKATYWRGERDEEIEHRGFYGVKLFYIVL